MFVPLSKLDYLMLEPNAQALVVACPMDVKTPEIRKHWASRAVASIGAAGKFVPDLVRDLLANPQVRIIVFHGAICGRDAYEAFWHGSDDPGWGIPLEHLRLVRQFVDLYDGDFGMRSPMAPYWPKRLCYHPKENP